MKKNITLSFAALLLASSLFNSCNKDDCEESVIESKSLEVLYGCTDTRNTLSIDLTNTAIIISNQTDYDAQVDGPCAPAIDFVT